MIFVKDRAVGTGHARCIEIRRPERANSLTIDLMTTLADAVRGAGDRPILLTAIGASFCAGLDLRELSTVLRQDESPRRMLDPLRALYTAIVERPAPTICLVNDAAVAGGVGLAAATDFISAVRGASFAIPQRIPLLPRIPAAMAHARIPALGLEQWIGYHVSADVACRDGFVDQVVPTADLARLTLPWLSLSSGDPTRRNALQWAIRNEFDHVIALARGRSAELISAIRAVTDR